MATFGESHTVDKENMVVIDLSGRGMKKIERMQDGDNTAVCTTLIIDKNGISKIENLEAFLQLQQLSIANNRLVRMNGIARLKTLRVLNLPNNSIQSIEGLRDLTELEWLNLSGNSIKNVDHLSTNHKLRHVDLSDNSISTILDISMLKNLTTFLLHGNILTTLRSVPSCAPKSIEILSLAENEISDLTEVSYLSCLSNLQQLSIMNNPCVMFASNTSSSHGGFDYRPYVVNWCTSLHILDGYAVSQKESLKAEWLYSQGKGRKFYPGQHLQLVEYLSRACPFTAASELRSKEEEKLLKVLQQHRKHQHDLQSGSTPIGPTPSLLSPSSNLLSPTPSNQKPRSTSRPKHALSPTGKKSSSKRAHSPLRSPSPSKVQSPKTAPSKAWGSDRVEDGPHLHRSFKPGGAGGTAMDLTLQDVDEEEEFSVKNDNMISESVYLPMSHHDPRSQRQASQGTNYSQRKLSPKLGRRNQVSPEGYGDTFNSRNLQDSRPERSVMSLNLPGDEPMDSNPQSDQSELSSYDAYDRRPLKPPREDFSFLQQVKLDEEASNSREKKTVRLHSPHKKSKSPHPGGREVRSKTTRKKDGAVSPSTSESSAKSSTPDSSRTEDLRKIKAIAESRRKERRGMSSEPAMGNDGQEGQKRSPTNHSFPDIESDMNLEEQAAERIQSMWKGYYTREKDPTTKEFQDTLYNQRMEEHVKFLTMELERTRQLYEQEKHLRTLQMEALKLLWNQVKTLQEWRNNMESAPRTESDTPTQGPVPKPSHNAAVQKVEDTTKQLQLEETCNNLQMQVSRLQSSLDQITSYFTSGFFPQSPSITLVSPTSEISDNQSGIAPHFSDFKSVDKEDKEGNTESLSQENNEDLDQNMEGVKGSTESHTITVPQNVTTSPRSETSVSITWDGSKVIYGDDTSSGVTGYKLHIDVRGHGKEEMDIKETRTTLGGLVAGTYRFAVSAHSSVGQSDLSPWTELTLPDAFTENKKADACNSTSDSSKSDHSTNQEQFPKNPPETIPQIALRTVEENPHSRDVIPNVKGQLSQQDLLVSGSSAPSSNLGVFKATDIKAGDGVVEDSELQETAVAVVAKEMSAEIVEKILRRVMSNTLKAGPLYSQQVSLSDQSSEKEPNQDNSEPSSPPVTHPVMQEKGNSSMLHRKVPDVYGDTPKLIKQNNLNANIRLVSENWEESLKNVEDHGDKSLVDITKEDDGTSVDPEKGALDPTQEHFPTKAAKECKDSSKIAKPSQSMTKSGNKPQLAASFSMNDSLSGEFESYDSLEFTNDSLDNKVTSVSGACKSNSKHENSGQENNSLRSFESEKCGNNKETICDKLKSFEKPKSDACQNLQNNSDQDLQDSEASKLQRLSANSSKYVTQPELERNSSPPDQTNSHGVVKKTSSNTKSVAFQEPVAEAIPSPQKKEPRSLERYLQKEAQRHLQKESQKVPPPVSPRKSKKLPETKLTITGITHQPGPKSPVKTLSSSMLPTTRSPGIKMPPPRTKKGHDSSLSKTLGTLRKSGSEPNLSMPKGDVSSLGNIAESQPSQVSKPAVLRRGSGGTIWKPKTNDSAKVGKSDDDSKVEKLAGTYGGLAPKQLGGWRGSTGNLNLGSMNYGRRPKSPSKLPTKGGREFQIPPPSPTKPKRGSPRKKDQTGKTSGSNSKLSHPLFSFNESAKSKNQSNNNSNGVQESDAPNFRMNTLIEAGDLDRVMVQELIGSDKENNFISSMGIMSPKFSSPVRSKKADELLKQLQKELCA